MVHWDYFQFIPYQTSSPLLDTDRLQGRNEVLPVNYLLSFDAESNFIELGYSVRMDSSTPIMYPSNLSDWERSHRNKLQVTWSVCTRVSTLTRWCFWICLILQSELTYLTILVAWPCLSPATIYEHSQVQAYISQPRVTIRAPWDSSRGKPQHSFHPEAEVDGWKSGAIICHVTIERLQTVGRLIVSSVMRLHIHDTVCTTSLALSRGQSWWRWCLSKSPSECLMFGFLYVLIVQQPKWSLAPHLRLCRLVYA